MLIIATQRCHSECPVLGLIVFRIDSQGCGYQGEVEPLGIRHSKKDLRAKEEGQAAKEEGRFFKKKARGCLEHKEHSVCLLHSRHEWMRHG